jgi:hypothetical protein
MSSSGEFSPELIDTRVNALRQEVQAKRKELSRLEAELEWWEVGRKFFGSEADGGDPGAAMAKKPTLRRAIVRVMLTKPKSSWLTETIIAELRGRDWLPTGKNAPHRTRSMLAQMARDDELKRTGRGRYRLADPEKWET